jgi:hypothetical protein
MVWRTYDARVGRPAARSGRVTALLVAVLVLTAFGAGCSSDDDGGDDDEGGSGSGNEPNEPRKPDTGYGADQTVPNPRTCQDFCARFGDCIVKLCGEDQQTSIYEGLEGVLASSCLASCSDSLLTSGTTSTEWQCYFQSSCREVFDYDDCHVDGYYYCN